MALLCKVFYNVYFRHRGIPARFWWAATDLAYCRSYASGQSHRQIERLHKDLGTHQKVLLMVGDIVRIQPDHISFNSLAAVEAIHGVRSKARKGEVYEYVMRITSDSPLTLFSETLPTDDLADHSDKRRHGLIRRIANPLFSSSALTQLEPAMKNYYSLFIKGVIEEAGENNGIVDITKWLDNLAFDVCPYLSF